MSAVSEGGGSIFEDGCCSPFWVSVVLAGILLHFGVDSFALLYLVNRFRHKYLVYLFHIALRSSIS